MRIAILKMSGSSAPVNVARTLGQRTKNRVLEVYDVRECGCCCCCPTLQDGDQVGVDEASVFICNCCGGGLLAKPLGDDVKAAVQAELDAGLPPASEEEEEDDDDDDDDDDEHAWNEDGECCNYFGGGDHGFCAARHGKPSADQPCPVSPEAAAQLDAAAAPS